MTLPTQLKSRKLWLAIVAAAVAFCNGMFDWNLTSDQVWQIVMPLLAFIGAEGVADAVERQSVAPAPSNVQTVEVKK